MILKKVGLFLFLILSNFILTINSYPKDFNIIRINNSCISGDSFRKLADHKFDNDFPYGPKLHYEFKPQDVKNGDIIFVSTEPINNLKKFFEKYHKKIINKYILITHNGDLNITDEYRKYLDDNKIFAWFAQNPSIKHHKLIAIPIGLENEYWARDYKRIIISLLKNIFDKENLVYANFNINTNVGVRKPIYEYFKNKDYCKTCSSRIDVKEYLNEVYKSKFILSPHGNGLDCHRTWEAIYLGVIPIVKESYLDDLYSDLPVLIIQNWGQLSRSFLETKWEQIKNRKYNKSKIYFDYWKNLIISYKNLCKNSLQKFPDFEISHGMNCNSEALYLYKKIYEKNNLDKLSKSIEPLIPLKIHQIWIGPKPIPEKLKWMMKTCKDIHPTWEYKLWTNEEVQNFNFQNKEAFDKAKNWGSKADILRYEILLKYGGVYLDLDIECLRSLDIFHHYYNFYSCLVNNSENVANGVIGSCPGHPILKKCLDQIGKIKKFGKEYEYTLIMKETGPLLFQDAIFQFLNNEENRERIIILPCTFFYPLPNNERFNYWSNFYRRDKILSFIKDESFAIHYWATSWQAQNPVS